MFNRGNVTFCVVAYISSILFLGASGDMSTQNLTFAGVLVQVRLRLHQQLQVHPGGEQRDRKADGPQPGGWLDHDRTSSRLMNFLIVLFCLKYVLSLMILNFESQDTAANGTASSSSSSSSSLASFLPANWELLVVGALAIAILFLVILTFSLARHVHRLKARLRRSAEVSPQLSCFTGFTSVYLSSIDFKFGLFLRFSWRTNLHRHPLRRAALPTGALSTTLACTRYR